MSIPSTNRVDILCAAPDTPAGRRLRKAFAEYRRREQTAFVDSDEQLLDYLFRRGSFADAKSPRLIILTGDDPSEINPATLDSIREDEVLRMIPVVVLTSPVTDDEIQRFYDHGVNSVIAMPESFDDLVWLMRSLAQYWLKVSESPTSEK